MGHRVHLHRCATGAALIGYPRTLLTDAVCTRRRTVLAMIFEPRHDLGLYAGVLFELRTMVCSLCACGAAAKSAVVAIARDVSMSCVLDPPGTVCGSARV